MDISFGKDGMVRAGISCRQDGSMKLFDPPQSDIDQNRRLFLQNAGVNPDRSVAASLAHGTTIAPVTADLAGTVVNGADGLITDSPGVALTITVADCLPLYAYDPIRRVIGIAHAGWRGVVANMPGIFVQTLAATYGSNPADIILQIGPHLRQCHFEIKDDISSQFEKRDILYVDNCRFVDLSAIVTRQLQTAGVRKVTVSDDCTYCRADRYFSFRRDRPKTVEAMIAFITLV